MKINEVGQGENEKQILAFYWSLICLFFPFSFSPYINLTLCECVCLPVSIPVYITAEFCVTPHLCDLMSCHVMSV